MAPRIGFLALAIAGLCGTAATSGSSAVQSDEKIAFATNRAPNLWHAAVYSIRPNGKGRRLLARGVPYVRTIQVSPNGRRLLYGENTLYIAHSDGSHARRLSPTSLQVSGGVFSPDGKRVAFAGARPCDEGCKAKVYVVRVDGSGLRALGRGYQPAWSPDSRHLAYTSLPGGSVYVANLRRPLRRLARGEHPAWAPNGRRIAYAQGGPEDALCFVNADGSARRCVAAQVGNRAIAGEIAWTPNGAKVAFIGERLMVVDANGAHLRQLTAGLRDRELAWSPNSRRVAYVHTQQLPDGGDQDQVHATSVGPRPASRRVTAEPIPTSVSNLRWTRNGIRYAAELRKNDLEIAIMGPGGGNVQILTRNGVDDRTPAWSPDRRTIAYSRAGALRLIAADGTRDRALTSGASIDMNPAWSPDGTKIAFVRLDSAGAAGPRLTVIRVADSQTTTLVTEPPLAPGRISWSPDGARIVFASGSGDPRDPADLFIVNADGTGLRLLRTDALALSPTWSPDGARIAFAGAAGDPGLYTIRPDGSGKMLVAYQSDFPEGASWSPAGDRLVFEEHRCWRECGVGGRIVTVRAGGGRRTRLTSDGAANVDPAWSR
jgi:Tol biopolymer transport system component